MSYRAISIPDREGGTAEGLELVEIAIAVRVAVDVRDLDATEAEDVLQVIWRREHISISLQVLDTFAGVARIAVVCCDG